MQDILHAVETEMKGSGSIIGYRTMHQRLVNHHNLVICKESFLNILRIVVPVGVENRSSYRLERRQYRSKGPNYIMIWHTDGYDKLKPFGFCIQGCIDGYSRRIIWLEGGVTNNYPDVTAGYFLDAIHSVDAWCTMNFACWQWYRKCPHCSVSAIFSKRGSWCICWGKEFHVRKISL